MEQETTDSPLPSHGTVAETSEDPSNANSVSRASPKSMFASSRLRDSLGRFLPCEDKGRQGNGDRATADQWKRDLTAKCMSYGDSDSVKIFGDGTDGRSACDFIVSVCIRRPNRISLFGNEYVSKRTVDSLSRRLAVSLGNEEKFIDTMKDAYGLLDEARANILNLRDNVLLERRSRNRWKAIALFAIVSSAIVFASIAFVCGGPLGGRGCSDACGRAVESGNQ